MFQLDSAELLVGPCVSHGIPLPPPRAAGHAPQACGPVPMRAALQDTVLTQGRRPRGVACAPAKLWQLAAHGTCRRRARRPMGRRCALVACLRRADVPAGSLAPPIDTRRHAAALRCRARLNTAGPQVMRSCAAAFDPADTVARRLEREARGRQANKAMVR
ncbi:hypothetical protein ERJ75_001119200 [Trypanosoma vivax]|nr:hypothetical protein ERJ75_001119200 [Trypanosoma vivax]